MLVGRKIALISCLLIFFFGGYKTGFCQSNELVLNHINITGIKRTKANTVYRALNLKQGESYGFSNINTLIESSKTNLKNLVIFNEIDVSPQFLGEDVFNLNVTVEERWYILPAPIFELADRNFNVWWEEQNRDLSRVNFGTWLYIDNFRGYADNLKIVAQFGFAPKQELRYTLPYFKNSNSYGMVATISRVTNNQIPYKTINNKLTFLEADHRLRNKHYAAFALTKRIDYRSLHALEVAYHNTNVHSNVALANPNYFGNGKTEQNYFSLYYRFEWDKTNFTEYPETGYSAKLEAVKHGLALFNDVNFWSFNTSINYFNQLGKKHFASTQFKTQLTLPTMGGALDDALPYFNSNGLGYRQNFVRGYELFAIDGHNYALIKANYKFKFLDQTINAPLGKKFDNIPLHAYLKAFIDYGRVEGHIVDGNNLVNSSMVGYGVGLDVKTYYNLMMRLEYSFNALGGSGLFLHFRLDINNANSYIW